MAKPSDTEWLDANKHIRMDAYVETSSKVRREFHIARYKFASEYVHNLKVLDGACGTGYGSAILGKQARSVTGIDLDADTIEYAKKHYGLDNTDFRTSTVELTPFEDSSFDAIVSFETIEHTLSPESHFKEMTRILKKEGIAILSVPNSWGLTDQHFFDFNYELLKYFTDRYFKKVEFFSNNPSKDYSRNSGIQPLKNIKQSTECILAVCQGPIKNESEDRDSRIGALLSDIYKNAFNRHNEYLNLNNKLIHCGVIEKIKLLPHRIRRRIRRS